MQRPIISLNCVHLSLESRAGSVSILNGVSLDIDSSESVAIVGPSGSGKTSLLMVVAGLEPVTSGTVEVIGQPFHRLGEDDLARIRGQSIGIVFQSFHLVPSMTAMENVALPLEFSGHGDPESVARQLLGDVGLSHRMDHYPAQLSGGEQQRVALARALSIEPRLLLADEPTGNLDSHTGRSVMDLLFGLQKKHSATLVLVTHDERLAQQCDRIIHMADGAIVDDRKAQAA